MTGFYRNLSPSSHKAVTRKEKRMNTVILMGRLTRDPEVRYTQGEKSMAVARYTLAVDRRRAADSGEHRFYKLRGL